MIYFSQGQFDQVAACHQQAIAVKPDFPQAHNHLGKALKELGDFDAAIAHYKQAIALKPGYAKAFNNWGNIFRDRGELQAAVLYYNQATAIARLPMLQATIDLSFFIYFEAIASADLG